MTRFNLIIACIVFAVIPRPVLASAGRYSISAEQIAVAVGRMGVRVSPSQITVLADALATTPSPVLQVRFSAEARFRPIHGSVGVCE